jgi:GNAT superfamily N-acetyltransferase
MRIDVSEQPAIDLDEYANVPVAFEVSTVLDVAEGEHPGKFILTERRLEFAFTKDYDAIPGNSPRDWAKQFDVSSWGFFSARVEGEHVGGAAIALKAPGVEMFAGRDGCAVLWDIRVAPRFRGHGIGAALFSTAEEWARTRHCRQLAVETQNTNVAACRFYARQGCELTAVNRHVYPELPDEIQLMWCKVL